MLKYKGYIADVVHDDSVNVLHGYVINTNDKIVFEGSTLDELQTAFEESIDDYLAFCKEQGVDPDKPFSGTFNVRIDPDLHKEAVIAAAKKRVSLNKFVEAAIKSNI